MRILTVTLHPCVDRVLKIGKLQAGGLIDAKLDAEYPAGKGVNTARVLRKLLPPAHEVTALAWAGGEDRAFFETRLTAENIRAVIVGRGCKTRRAHTILEESGRETHIKEIMPAPTKEECAALLAAAGEAFKSADAVAFCGSAPSGTPSAVLKELLTLARSSVRYVLVDSHGVLLKLAAKAAPDLLKGNTEEIGQLLGLKAKFNPDRERDQELIAKSLAGKGAPKRVLMTLGAEGGLLTQIGYTIQLPAPDLKAGRAIVSATGCGDAATAGWLAGIALRRKPDELLKLALSCGTAKLYSSDPGSIGKIKLK